MKNFYLAYWLLPILGVFWNVQNASAQMTCPNTDDFTTAGANTYVVPTGAHHVTITLSGADGGNTPSATGGEGATVEATFPVCPECTVKPGSTLNIYLGGVGSSSTVSATAGGAGGGGTSIVVVDGVAYPLLIAGGGGGASSSNGSGASADFIIDPSGGNGGTQTSGGGGGGGAGVNELDGSTNDGGNGLSSSPDPGAIGGVGFAEILTGVGGNGGGAAGSDLRGEDGGIGGGGAGGNSNSVSYGGGGGGAGYSGGKGGVGTEGGYGGSSYIYPGNTGVTRTDGVTGGGTLSNGSASICYSTNSSEIVCDLTKDQLFNPGFDSYGDIDSVNDNDIYVNDDAICFESWERIGDAWQNEGGTSNGANCTRAVLFGESGLLSQTSGTICKSQRVDLCFELTVISQGGDTDLIINLGGQGYFVLDWNGVSDNQYFLGLNADTITVTNSVIGTQVGFGETLNSGTAYDICITDYNYDGDIPAKLEIIGNQTRTTASYNDIVIQDFVLNYGEMGPPQLKDPSSDPNVPDPAACTNSYDLTVLNPDNPADQLIFTWKDDSGNPVADPTQVGNGSYTACYTRETINPECSTPCLDEVCSELVVVECTADTDEDGIPDSVEIGSNTSSPKDTDGDGVPDFLDLDSDNDGIPDSKEVGSDPTTPVDTDGDGVPDYEDLDSDNDGINDVVEGGDNALDTNNDGVIDSNDTGFNDADGDGMSDDSAATDPTTVDTDGDSNPDWLDPDSNNAGEPSNAAGYPDNNSDGFPDGPDADGDGILDNNDTLPNEWAEDRDSDNDGIPDSVEIGDPNNPTDTDGDGVPDFQDLDSDNDGIPDSLEAGSDSANPTDSDGDGVPDYKDLDSDNDGINDVVEGGDNALDTNNDGVIDSNDNGYNDADGDGMSDDSTATDPTTVDTDGDSTPDWLDPDSNNAGQTSNAAGYPDNNSDGFPDGPDADGDGILDNNDTLPNEWAEDRDSDNDGIPDSVEIGDPNNPTDTDGDGVPDHMDLDSDNDGIPDSLEAGSDSANPTDSDGDGVPDYKDLDSDNDGINDVVEGGDGALDTNGDGVIDSNDNGFNDADGDGMSDDSTATDPTAVDTDSDSNPDWLDPDSNNAGQTSNAAGYPDNNSDGFPDGPDADGDGILDNNDTWPNEWAEDRDSDNDGIPDSVEIGDPNNPTDTDGDGVPDHMDLDSDNDGIPDSLEAGSDSANPTDTDGDGVPDYKDLDSDNDGINDVVEGGDGALDTNGDGVIDSNDNGFNDADGDGMSDDSTATDPTAVDTDSDSNPDWLDPDSNNAGEPSNAAGYPDNNSDGFPDGPDADGDGILDNNDTLPNEWAEERDSDGDGIPDSVEIGDPNNPTDTDGDGVPDHMDLDSDNDGIPDSLEAGSNPANPTDSDGDGVPDYKDLDSDNDGINDVVEGGDGALDTNGDGFIDSNDDGFADADGDGMADNSTSTDATTVDTDSDSNPDWLDPDSNNAGEPSNAAGYPDNNSDGFPDGPDTDGDGILDASDAAPGVFGEEEPTPVTMGQFTVTKQLLNAYVSWETITEENNSHFEVERSVDGKDWTLIGKVKGAGTSSSKQNYNFTDSGIGKQFNQVYYRLKQVDFDGKQSYTKVVGVSFEGKKDIINIYPNPASEYVVIQTGKITDLTVQLYDVHGKLLIATSATMIDVSDLDNGTYFIRVVDRNQQLVSTEKLIIVQ